MRSSSRHLLAAFAIALGLALAIGFAEARFDWKSCFTGKGPESDPSTKLKRICMGEKVEISSIDALTSLQGAVAKAKDTCDYIDFAALHLLIKITHGPNVCSLDKATKIANFYKNWLVRRPETKRSHRLRPSFRDFFLAYGLKMSALCEETMMKEFTYRPYHTEHLYEPGSQIDRLLTPLIESNKITLPSLVSTILPMLGDGRVLVQSDHSDIRQLEDAQKVCRLRFRPLYEHFLEPIAILAQSGFAHRSDYFEQMTGESGSWTKIVFLCEILDSLQFGTSSAEDGRNDDEQTTGSRLKSTRAGERKREIEMDPTIFDRRDGSLVEAVRDFDAGKCEIDRSRLFAKIWFHVAERFVEEDRSRSLIELIGNLRQKEDDTNLATLEEDLVQLLDLLKSGATLHTQELTKTVADGLYQARALGRWLVKAAFAGLLLPPGAALHPLSQEPTSGPAPQD
jgi:hypothetical protein